MPRIPLEDNFSDLIAKAQRGLHVTDEDLARRAEVKLEDIIALKSGEVRLTPLRRIARHLMMHPQALEALALGGWYPTSPAFSHGFLMFNTTHEDMTVNNYLLWDGGSRAAAVFDTGTSCAELLDYVKSESLRIQHIFLTHTHEDHIADLANLQRVSGAEVWVHSAEPPPPGIAVRTFTENAYFHLGKLAIKTLLTSGHSPGQTTYYVTGLSWPIAFCGDTLFAGSVGGSPTAFREQIHTATHKLLALPRDTVIAPGHGPLTTVLQEKKHNPFFC